MVGGGWVQKGFAEQSKAERERGGMVGYKTGMRMSAKKISIAIMIRLGA